MKVLLIKVFVMVFDESIYEAANGAGSGDGNGDGENVRVGG